MTVSIEVENIGMRAGTEIVKLYIRDLMSSVTVPVKQLKGWKRIGLAKGEKKLVDFVVGPEAFTLVNAECISVIEPGIFQIMVGGSSQNEDLIKFEIEVIE